MAELNEYGIYFLYWAIIVTITLVVLAILVVVQRRKHDFDMNELTGKYEQKQTKAFSIGRSGVRGELNEILGSFALLNEYDQLALLSSVSKQFSIDLLGIKEDSVDFIEVKSLGTPLSPHENNVKKLIDENKVRYVIMEGNIPKSFKIKERE